MKGVRNHLAHLTSTRKLLKSALLTRWGVYVWKELDYFFVDNHLANSSCSFRGRPITENNIQVGVSFSLYTNIDIGSAGFIYQAYFVVGLHKRRHIEISSEEIAALAGARSKLLRTRRGTPDMSRASAPLAPAAGASNFGRFLAVEIFDGQLDLSRERFALYESVYPTLRSAASPTDAPRELQQLLE